ncbi:hypothetical protein IV203_025907 [Nitzschia inconspicua]|uniref:Uncharacterized protein n=1 Tax=Nitzschia inconspicua TaxID=303405 RepID=A0A9K3LK20_9STRA|nr:hypothetical protein IV203_025907 [Nitzschia inconspicua]
MRLTVAATTTTCFLATNAAGVGASSSFSSSLQKQMNDPLDTTTLASSILQLAVERSHDDKKFSRQNYHRRRQRRQQRKLSSRLYSNRKLVEEDDSFEQVECSLESSSSSSSMDADIGILSCPTGQYCIESSQSSLGGYCHSRVHVVEEAIMEEQVIRNPPFGRRQRTRELYNDYEDDTQTPFLDLAQDLCSMATPAAAASNSTTEHAMHNLDKSFQCDTCTIRHTDYMAEFDCSYGSECYSLGSLCNSTQVEFCQSHSLEGTLLGQHDFQFKACYTITKPQDFSYCITYNYYPETDQDTSCEIEIDGVICNSCTLIFQDPITGDWCREFDCDNTPLGKSASICDYSILEAFTTGYLYNQLPCDNGCNLCGDGKRMVDASATQQFTGSRVVASTFCFQRQLQALTGSYNPQQCLELEDLLDGSCHCEEVSSSDSNGDLNSTDLEAGAASFGDRRSLWSSFGKVTLASVASLSAFL